MATKQTIPTMVISQVPDNVDANTIVMVRNGVYATLIYKSTKSGEEFVWEEFGDSLEMTIGELRIAKSSQKSFFANNWFMFDEEYSWVIEYLGVKQYYEHTLSIESLEDIVNLTPVEIKKVVSQMTSGQKESLTYHIRSLVCEDEIDSRKTIAALEDALGIILLDEK